MRLIGKHEESSQVCRELGVFGALGLVLRGGHSDFAWDAWFAGVRGLESCRACGGNEVAGAA
jgi:hypothetical protein